MLGVASLYVQKIGLLGIIQKMRTIEMKEYLRLELVLNC